MENDEIWNDAKCNKAIMLSILIFWGKSCYCFLNRRS